MNSGGKWCNCVICKQRKPKKGARINYNGHIHAGFICRDCQGSMSWSWSKKF